MKSDHEAWPECEAQENHTWLLAEYAALLERYSPESVLDVGCGQGLLLRTLRDKGLAVQGLDQAGPRLDALNEEGFDVREGSAYELPFEDGSIDWLSLRHVPHHLEDPARAFAEALRVARRGLLLAEPCFDPGLPSQRAALALDVWEKRQHRRRGMFHAESLALPQLLSLLPASFEAQFDVEVYTHFRPRCRSVEVFEAEAKQLLAELEESQAEHVALQELLVDLRRHGLSWNGSLCVALRRR